MGTIKTWTNFLENNYWLVPLVIILLTFLVRYFFRLLFDRFIFKSSHLLQTDPTNYKFLSHSISALIFTIGFGFAILSIPFLKTAATSILAGAGIAALAIGLASQQALSNIVSGIFIVLFKPFRVHDRLKIRDSLIGIVEDITLRHTVLRDFENKRIIIPNSVISNEIIINSDFSDEKICRWVDIQIAYHANLPLAKKIIEQQVLGHPNFLDNRTPEQIEDQESIVPVRVISLNDSSLTLRAWTWAKDVPSAFIMNCDLNESIKLAFDDNGIEIPYPYQNVVIKK